MALPHDLVQPGGPWILGPLTSCDPVESPEHTNREVVLHEGAPPEVEDLLRARDPADRDRAWRAFLRAYEAAIRHALGDIGEGSRDPVNRFADVVERLRRDDFHCLMEYPGRTHCRFTTWLCVVIRRLDAKPGNRRTGLPPALSSLLAERLGIPDPQSVETELGRLAPRERLLLRLHVQHGLSARRISVLMGYASASQVRSRCEDLCEALRLREKP